MHWGWNVAMGAIFGLPVSGFAFPGILKVELVPDLDWLSGGAFGPEAGVAGTVAAGLLGLLVWKILPPDPAEAERTVEGELGSESGTPGEVPRSFDG
jgi:hypothetical protein